MTNKKINDKVLNNVVGGDGKDNYIPPKPLGTFHKDCRGKLRNVGRPFRFVYCSKCNEEHFMSSSFKKYGIAYYPATNSYEKDYDDGYREKLDTRPEELDWPCNQ